MLRGERDPLRREQRKLSASCGTCVAYQAAQPLLERMDADVERVFQADGETYTLLLDNE